MINDHTLSRFERLDDGLVKPIYADYAFVNIPATVHRLLTGETIGPLLPADCFGGQYPAPKRVVLVFVDSFGWQFWQRHWSSARTLSRVVEQGILTPISSLFPSTTAASVSALNFGVPPARHGVYEWNMYVPAYGQVIQSLPFASLGKGPGSCAKEGHDIGDLLLVRETAHQRLGRHGVRSIQLAHRSYAGSAYNTLASAGAEVIMHSTLAEALTDLRALLEGETGKAFINFYWAGLDTAAHIHGPGSPVHDAEVRAFWAAFDALIEGVAAPDTLFLFTADHGHVGAPAASTINVNEVIPWLQEALARSPTGAPIWPSGSPRDMFLHVETGRRVEVIDALRYLLGAKALVTTVDDGLAQGLFGPDPVGAEFRRRLGDVLVLPRLGHFVWWREPGLIGNAYHGHHGGLTPEEVTTVLGVVDRL